jgi:hypothetical protein
MKKHTLSLDGDGDVWLREDDDDAGSYTAWHLGEPREELYAIVPQGLWEELSRFIVDFEDGVRFTQGCKDAAEAAWWRAKHDH